MKKFSLRRQDLFTFIAEDRSFALNGMSCSKDSVTLDLKTGLARDYNPPALYGWQYISLSKRLIEADDMNNITVNLDNTIVVDVTRKRLLLSQLKILKSVSVTYAPVSKSTIASTKRYVANLDKIKSLDLNSIPANKLPKILKILESS